MSAATCLLSIATYGFIDEFGVMFCSVAASARLQLVELAQQQTHSRHALGPEVVYRAWVDGNADSAYLGVHTEGCLEQAIAVLRD